jgi:hypothetical protein
MPAPESATRATHTKTVDPQWGEPARPRDETPGAVTSRDWRGVIRQALSCYGWVALLILATGVVNVLAATQHTALTAANLRDPVLDESTSAVVLIALLPLLKQAVDKLATPRDRRLVIIHLALAIAAYAVLHVVAMVLLRDGVFALVGGGYTFRWRDAFVPELRKDLISAFMIVVVFWLIDRRAGKSATIEPVPAPEAAGPQPRAIWLRDGSTNMRVDPAQIVCVRSAGNYVEFVLPDQTHLIRGTLAQEEARLRPFGILRVHRTSLVNASRIIAIEQRPRGDLLIRMDTGAAIAGSRRYREALAFLTSPPNGER